MQRPVVSLRVVVSNHSPDVTHISDVTPHGRYFMSDETCTYLTVPHDGVRRGILERSGTAWAISAPVTPWVGGGGSRIPPPSISRTDDGRKETGEATLERPKA